VSSIIQTIKFGQIVNFFVHLSWLYLTTINDTKSLHHNKLNIRQISPTFWQFFQPKSSRNCWNCNLGCLNCIIKVPRVIEMHWIYFWNQNCNSKQWKLQFQQKSHRSIPTKFTKKYKLTISLWQSLPQQ